MSCRYRVPGLSRHRFTSYTQGILEGRPRKNQISHVCQRQYANPANIRLPSRLTYKPPPSPPQPLPDIEHGHAVDETAGASGPFDRFVEQCAQNVSTTATVSVSMLYHQYQDRAHRVIDRIVPYEERPVQHRKSHASSEKSPDRDEAGDGLVMIIHALEKANGKLDKICACSGFVVNAVCAKDKPSHDEVVISCAHTLEEMYRKLPDRSDSGTRQKSFSFAISSTGRLFTISETMSSAPRSDIVAYKIRSTDSKSSVPLRSLPISPFPVATGATVLTHLFDTPKPPNVRLSASRLPTGAKQWSDKEITEAPTKWLADQVWRRWGVGTMLGYRSYTGIEVEAGIHSSLPHILTSVIPTPGSSGGPLVCADTGAVVGMISGRRMDNRVEGERGWGASAEGILEMFSLPGFTPTISE